MKSSDDRSYLQVHLWRSTSRKWLNHYFCLLLFTCPEQCVGRVAIWQQGGGGLFALCISNPINAEMEDASIENTTDYWYEAVKYCAGGRCYEYTHYWQPLSFPCIECAFNVLEFVAFAIVDFNSWKTFGETTFWKDFMRKIAAFVAIFRKSGWTRPINLSLLRLGPQESSNSDITK